MFTSALLFTGLSLVTRIALAAPADATVSCTFNSDTYGNPLTLNPAQGRGPLGPVFGYDTNFHLSDAEGSTITGDDPLVVVNVTTNYPWPTFAAYACDSTYMGYAANSTGANGLPLQYGHLAFVNSTCGPPSSSCDADVTCIALTTAPDGKQYLTQEPCATADDASQVPQFFEIAYVEDGFGLFLANVSYVGAPASSAADVAPVYFSPGRPAEPAIAVGSEEGNYQLQFEYIHIN